MDFTVKDTPFYGHINSSKICLQCLGVQTSFYIVIDRESPTHKNLDGAVITMAKSKEARSVIKLVSTESKHCYFSEKNRNNSKERIQIKKYDPTLRKHVIYKEAGKL